MQNVIAGVLGFFLGPVGLWYKGRWAAGFAWIFIGVPVAWVFILSSKSAESMPAILLLMAAAQSLHAMIAEPQVKRKARAIAEAIAIQQKAAVKAKDEPPSLPNRGEWYWPTSWRE